MVVKILILVSVTPGKVQNLNFANKTVILDGKQLWNADLHQKCWTSSNWGLAGRGFTRITADVLHTISLKHQKMLTVLCQHLYLASMLWRAVTNHSYRQDSGTKKPWTKINLLTQKPWGGRKQQRGVATLSFMWSVGHSFHVTGCATEEVTFTSTSRDHVLPRGLCCHMQSLLPVQLQANNC